MFKKSDIFFLSATLISFLFATYVFFTNADKTVAVFIGLWIPSILALGIYFRTLFAEERK
ncbi:MAG: hypothetical protein IAF08_05090 [Rhizobacter sp.]|nr:hypothetical protein [Chlorobiales bacterium]